MSARTVTIVDAETGGLDETEHQITELGALNFDLDTFVVNWEYQSFIKPYCGLTYQKDVIEKTLVKEQDILNGKEAKIVVSEFSELLRKSNSSNGKTSGNTILCGHNIIAFDRLFLEALFLYHNKNLYLFASGEMFDTLPDARRLWCGEKEKHNLKACCERIGYNLTGAHGALNDVRATFELFKYQTNRLRDNSNLNTKSNGENKTPIHRKYFQF